MKKSYGVYTPAHNIAQNWLQRNLCNNEPRDCRGMTLRVLLSCSSWMWECGGHWHTKMLQCMLLFILTECLPDMRQVVHLIITMPLIHLQLRIKIFMHMSYPRLIWMSIDLVSSWLKSFHSATMQMSTTKVPMLSMHMLSFGDSKRISKGILRSLPATVSSHIKHGLIDVHTKLSDYYHKYDESPFCTWGRHVTWFIQL